MLRALHFALGAWYEVRRTSNEMLGTGSVRFLNRTDGQRLRTTQLKLWSLSKADIQHVREPQSTCGRFLLDDLSGLHEN